MLLASRQRAHAEIAICRHVGWLERNQARSARNDNARRAAADTPAGLSLLVPA